jgi:diguanylate cyclase (GGDEF)-like protein
MAARRRLVYGVRVPRPSRRLWLAYLCVGVAGILAYYLVPARGAGLSARIAVYGIISASAAAAVWYGTARYRPRARLPWLLLAAGQVVYAVADMAFHCAHYTLDAGDHAFLVDMLHLGHYPLVVAGLALLIRRRTAGRDPASLMDAAVIAVAAALLCWQFVISIQVRGQDFAFVTLVGAGYPVMDLALLAVAVRLVLGTGRRPPAYFLLTASLFATLGADTVYLLQSRYGGYQVGNLLDAAWLAGSLGLGAAALHPTMIRLGEPAPARPGTLGLGRFVALMAAVLLAPAALLYQWARHQYADIPVTAVACAVLFGLTIARMAGLVNDQRRLAVTDGLTGLHTRRFAEAQLALEVARARRTGGTLGFFIADVDNFKSINDRYGHPAGDQALVEIAARLREVTRPGDVLARYGGEEFALLVPGASPDELREIAERLREWVAGNPIAVCAETYVAVTVAVGAAGYPLSAVECAGAAGSGSSAGSGTPAGNGVPAGSGAAGGAGTPAGNGVLAGNGVSAGFGASAGSGFFAHRDAADEALVQELVAVADRALCRAKAAGRNRVVVGRPAPESDRAGSGAGVFDLAIASGRDAAMVDFLRHVADQVDARLSPQEHSRAVGRWARLLATELGHDEATVTRAELAGRLHDIGKIILPETLLAKPSRLSDEEWRLLRQHPVHGARLAGLVPEFGGVAEVIRQHHERFDGAGYPDRLSGTAIRLEARILAVCDSWAAMRSDRAYQARLSEEEAREQLRLGRGTQFDPDIVDLFLDLLGRGLVGELAPGSGRPAWSSTVS